MINFVFTCSMVLIDFGVFIPKSTCTVAWADGPKVVLQCNVKSDKLMKNDNGPWMQKVHPNYLEENCEVLSTN